MDAHTTKNGEARSFPFTTDIEKVLKSQLTEHERPKAEGSICPFVFHRNGEDQPANLDKVRPENRRHLERKFDPLALH